MGKRESVGPRSPYDESKRFSEALCKAYEKKYGLDVRVLRIFDSVGPRLRPEGLYGRAVSRFILQAAEGCDITVYGNGSQTRSFCYVTDTVKATLLALTNDSARGEVLNIGSTEEITILELAKKIRVLVKRLEDNVSPTPTRRPKEAVSRHLQGREVIGFGA